MIRYKVVTNKGFSAFVGSKDLNNSYRLVYMNGEIVEANKNSIGIMVFDTLENAVAFISNYMLENSHPKIKKVETLSEETIPKYISANVCEWALCYFYDNYLLSDEPVSVPPVLRNPPKGTICCHKIKVIETVKTF